jgi:ribosomal 30S subunit maturation factor RimM
VGPAPERHDRGAPGGPQGGPPPGAVRLGRLGRTYGLAGAQRLHPAGPAETDALLGVERLWVQGHGTLAVRMVKPHAGALLVAFQGVRSPERAQELVNADVYAEAGTVADDVAARSVDRLTGAEVRVDGAPYGRVVEVVARAQMLLLVRGPHGERWLPADAPYVRVDGGVVHVDDPPAGLLDDDA